VFDGLVIAEEVAVVLSAVLSAGWTQWHCCLSGEHFVTCGCRSADFVHCSWGCLRKEVVVCAVVCGCQLEACVSA